MLVHARVNRGRRVPWRVHEGRGPVFKGEIRVSVGLRTIEQVVSRYHPVFDVPTLRMGFGRDGYVYLVVGGRPDGRALRLKPDGSEQTFARVGYAAQGITADAQGVIATADAHFPHRITFWDVHFNELGHYDEFAAADDVGYYSPGGVEAAESGGFYAIDQHVRRVLKPDPAASAHTSPSPGSRPTCPTRPSRRRARSVCGWRRARTGSTRRGRPARWSRADSSAPPRSTGSSAGARPAGSRAAPSAASTRPRTAASMWSSTVDGTTRWSSTTRRASSGRSGGHDRVDPLCRAGARRFRARGVARGTCPL